MNANRIDSNQTEIVEGLRKLGFSVELLNAVKHGCPDILVGARGINLVMEVKRDHKSKLTPDEQNWQAKWQGQCNIIHNLEEALAVIELHTTGD